MPNTTRTMGAVTISPSLRYNKGQGQAIGSSLRFLTVVLNSLPKVRVFWAAKIPSYLWRHLYTYIPQGVLSLMGWTGVGERCYAGKGIPGRLA